MKKHPFALCAAFLLGLLLTACGAGANAGSAPADSAAAGDSQPAAADSDYAYPEDFDYSALFDERGYVADVTANDYVTLPENYAALTLPAGTDTVADDEVEANIAQYVLAYYSTVNEVTDRAAEMGDTVHIDYVGSVDGVEFEGGSTQGAGTDLELTGSNYIDDFEQQIAGHMPGETFNVEVTFPDPYQNNPDLAGKDAVFVTTLHYIAESVTPELTDDFVMQNLNADTGWQTAADVREYYRTHMLFDQQSSAVYALLDESVAYADPLPESMQDFFDDYALFSLVQYGQQFGMDADTILTQMGYESAAQYLEAQQGTTTSNIRSLLLVQALAEKLGIAADDAAVEEYAEAVFGTADIAGYEAQYGKGYLRMMVLEHLVLESLIESATVAAE